MVAEEIERVKNAELEALQLINEARQKADAWLKEARERVRIQQEIAETNAKKECERILRASREYAERDAERIRAEAIREEEGIAERAEARIPLAVKWILQRVTGG